MKLYFCSIDGNPRGAFKHEENANKWKEDQNTDLAFVNEVTYDNKNIVLVDGHEFNSFVESISDEVGTDEFNRVKTVLEKEWAYTEVTND